MKAKTGLMIRYAPVWAIVFIMILLFFSSTLPAISNNKDLKRSEAEKRQNIKALDQEARRVKNLLRALDDDPITVENELRRQFNGVKKEGEIIVDQEQ